MYKMRQELDNELASRSVGEPDVQKKRPASK